MSDRKVELYESIIRLSLLLVFMFALIVGTVGVFSICQMLMQEVLNFARDTTFEDDATVIVLKRKGVA